MIWIKKFPLPPSVNEYLMPSIGKLKINKKTGKSYTSAGWIKTAVHRVFEEDCHIWRYKNLAEYKNILKAMDQIKEEYKQKGKHLILRIDICFVFHYSRVWTVGGGIKRIDADNRLKPCLDAISSLLGLDDAHFFSDSCEKVTATNKEDEGAYIKISTMEPRTVENILELIA